MLWKINQVRGLPNDEGLAILDSRVKEGFWLRDLCAGSMLGSYLEEQHSTEMVKHVQRPWGRSMFCVFQKHREVRVAAEGWAEAGQHDETLPGEQRIVISETEAGARPHSILRVTVSSLDSVLQWEVSTCNMLTFFFFYKVATCWEKINQVKGIERDRKTREAV